MRPIAYLSAWSVVMASDSVQALANEDGVQWLGDLPHGPEPDNDGIRSATGVNANAVAAGTAYNLTGSGVTVGSWDEAQATGNHQDFTGRITLVGTIPYWGRYQQHEDVAAGTPRRYDDGENGYIDMDDNGCVSVGDKRTSPINGVMLGPDVQPGDADVIAGCTPLVSFWLGDPAGFEAEKYVDLDANLRWDFGEPVYVDMDNDGKVTAAVDTPKSVASAVDGTLLTSFNNRHSHPTMVAGTIMGSGAGSAGAGGSALQWMGVAPGAQLRSYALCQSIACVTQAWTTSSATTYVGWLSEQYTDAGANGTAIAAQAWGSQLSHYHELAPADSRYGALSAMFDEVVSGFTSDGTASGLPRLLVVASAGNAGAPERHTENVSLNGRYDAGESIYLDSSGDGVATSDDRLLRGTAQPGADLIDFQPDERHTELLVGRSGTLDGGEGIYRDVDRSNTVSVLDVRIDVPGFTAGSIVAAASSDIRTPPTSLRQFKKWGTLRSANAAKNTLQLGMIASDVLAIPANGSRGPTDDGRIKPDLVAAGAEVGGEGVVHSTHTRNRYTWLANGTSFSTGAAAGSAALLTEWYRTACSSTVPAADVLKALLIHGAEDVVLSTADAGTGPDFATGYGRLRVKEAIDLVPHHLIGSTADVIPPISVTIGRTQRLKVTLVWNDAPSVLNATPGTHGLLQNDLDLTLIAPDGKQFTPWVLDPLNPLSAATRGIFASGAAIPESARDRVNTVEQVVVDDAKPGEWKILVTASQLTYVNQPFTIVSEALSPASSPCSTTPAGDVWLRDNTGDTGAVPSSGLLWLSPDVWNRLAADGRAEHENPEFGQENHLYANVRNASANTVKATTVEIWIAEAATGLSWPANFRLVGRMHAPNLTAGEVRTIGPLAWNPPTPGASGHFCIYVRVLSPQDAITIVEGSEIASNTRNSNNIAWRNIHIVDLHSQASQTFVVRNIDSTRKAIQLDLRVPPAFLSSGGQVRVSLSQALVQRVRTALVARGAVSLADSVAFRDPPPGAFSSTLAPYRVTAPESSLEGFVLEPREAHRITITFQSSNTEVRSYDVDVIQRSGTQIIGGIRYVVRTGHP